MKANRDIFTQRPRAHLLAGLIFSAAAAFAGSVIGSAYLAPHPAAAQSVPLGNGGPALCDGVTISCATGVGTLNLANPNIWTATQTVPNLADTALSATAGAAVCSAGASQLLTSAGCTAGGGVTLTSPAGSLTIGGTSTAPTADINYAHSPAWTAAETNTAQLQLLGAGGANACAGAKYPTTVYGACFGANNGATNVAAIVIGPTTTDFNCSASCPTGDSARINFYDATASGAAVCQFWFSNGFGQLATGCGVHVGGGNFTVVGQANAESNGAANTAPVPPMYTATGTGSANTMHGDSGTCAFAAATTCAVTLSGTGNAFVSATSYACSVSMGSATTYIGYTVGNQTTTTFTIYASASNSNTVAYACLGT